MAERKENAVIFKGEIDVFQRELGTALISVISNLERLAETVGSDDPDAASEEAEMLFSDIVDRFNTDLNRILRQGAKNKENRKKRKEPLSPPLSPPPSPPGSSTPGFSEVDQSLENEGTDHKAVCALFDKIIGTRRGKVRSDIFLLIYPHHLSKLEKFGFFNGQGGEPEPESEPCKINLKFLVGRDPMSVLVWFDENDRVRTYYIKK